MRRKRARFHRQVRGPRNPGGVSGEAGDLKCRNADIVFFVTRPTYPARGVPLGDYLSAERFAATNPDINVAVLTFGEPATKVCVRGRRICIHQPDTGWIDLSKSQVFVYFPVSFELEDVTLRHPDQNGGPSSFAHRQWRVVTELLENTLPTIGTCINHPARSRLACNKLYQRSALCSERLRFIPGLVTNDFASSPEEHRAADRLIVKYISEGGDLDGEDSTQLRAVSELVAGYRDGAPRMHQELLLSDHELRFYVFEDEVHALRVEVRDKARVPDIRDQARTPDEFSLTDQYDAWFEDIRQCVKGLGLCYAAIDAIPAGGGLELLEVNVNGTWQWLPDPIARTLTDAFHALLRRKLARPE